MSAVVSAIGGMMQAESSKDAAKIAGDAAMVQAEIDEDRLEFQMQAYEDTMNNIADLEEIFGPMRDNIARYYNNLSPEMYQMQGKEAIERQYQKAEENISAVFSNNGMFNSGQMAGARVALEASRAESLARNQQQAPQQYIQGQSQALSMGLNEMASQRGQSVQQQGMVSSAMQQQGANTNQAGQVQAGYAQQQGQIWGNTLNQIGSSIGLIGGAALMGGFSGKTVVTKG